MRHGRTDDTDQLRVRGGTDAGPALNPAGAGEVRELAAALTGAPQWFGRPVVLLSSPVLRARQTASIIGAALGLTPQFDDAWSEVSLGEWDGLSYAQIATGWPERFAAWRGSTAIAPPRGESLDDVGARVGAARDRLPDRYAGQVVLVVSHTAPIRTVIAQALGAGAAALWRLRVDPARLSVIRFWVDGGCEVVTVNSAADRPVR